MHRIQRTRKLEVLEDRQLLTAQWIFDEASGSLDFEIATGDSLRITHSGGQTLLNGLPIRNEPLLPEAIHSISIKAPDTEFTQSITVDDFPALEKIRLELSVGTTNLRAGSQIDVQQSLQLLANGINMDAEASISSATETTISNSSRHACVTNIHSLGPVTLLSDLFEAYVNCGIDQVSITATALKFDSFHGPIGQATTDPLDVRVESLEGICDCPVFIAQHGDLTLDRSIRAEGKLNLQTLNVRAGETSNDADADSPGDLVVRYKLEPTIDFLAYELRAAGDFQLYDQINGRTGELGGGSVLIEAQHNVLLATTSQINADTTTIRRNGAEPGRIDVLGKLTFGGMLILGGTATDEIAFQPSFDRTWSESTMLLDGREGADIYRLTISDVPVEIRDEGTDTAAIDQLVFDAQGRTVVDTGSAILVDGIVQVGYAGIESVLIRNQPVTGDLNGDGRASSEDIDQLYAAIAAGETREEFDLSGDQQLDLCDVDIFVRETLKTNYGDSDLNGRVEFADFVPMIANFGHANVGWAGGDVNGDGTVDFTDFVLLANNFGFQRPN